MSRFIGAGSTFARFSRRRIETQGRDWEEEMWGNAANGEARQ